MLLKLINIQREDNNMLTFNQIMQKCREDMEVTGIKNFAPGSIESLKVTISPEILQSAFRVRS